MTLRLFGIITVFEVFTEFKYKIATTSDEQGPNVTAVVTTVQACLSLMCILSNEFNKLIAFL